jgi:putative addiction module killer protein
MDAAEKQVRIYRLSDGRVPYLEWFRRLKDQRAQQKIQVRIGRVRLGNFGDTRFVGDGVQELKIDYGPGYRVYFRQAGQDLVILLCGGDKSTQDNDIKEAKQYWADYKKEKSYADH